MDEEMTAALGDLEKTAARVALQSVRIRILGALPADATDQLQKWNTLQLALRLVDEELARWS